MTTSQGAVISGNPVSVNIGAMPPGAVTDVSFQVRIDNDTPDGTIIANQGRAAAEGGADEPSDDNGADADGKNPTLTPVVVASGAIGNRVWLDRNQNGIQNAGEPGISGMTIQLIDAATGAVLRTTVSDAEGRYLFENLPAGDYIVAFSPIRGYSFTQADTGDNDDLDSDVVFPHAGRTGVIHLANDEINLSVDGGIFLNIICLPRVCSWIASRVWWDENGDGIRNANERGAGGVALNLYDVTGEKLIAKTRTSENGVYSFARLNGGRYVLEILPPAGYELTAIHQGEDSAVDSDADPMTGRIIVAVGTGECYRGRRCRADPIGSGSRRQHESESRRRHGV